MSTRTSLRPVIVFNAVSMASSQTSAVTILQSLSKLAYTISWTGSSPVGTLALQGSNDYSLNPNGTVDNTGTWSPLTVSYNGSNTSSISISGNSGSGIIDVANTGLYAVRLVYTAGSGSGSLTAVINAKVS